MPDIGDIRTATLTVDPADSTTTGTLTVHAPDGTTTTPTVSGNGTGTLTATVTYTMAGWWLLYWQVAGTGASVEYQRVFVSPSPTSGTAPAYATLEKLKKRLAITDSADDDALLDALDSASREIDKHCKRRFYLDPAVSTRVFPATDSPCLAMVDDFATTTGLVIKTDTAGDGTYATTWATTDRELLPLNGIVDGVEGWPFNGIRAIGDYRFELGTDRPAQLQVTAQWGWAAVPRPVEQACLIMAQANFKLKDAAFGSVGVADLGIVTVRQVPAAATKLVPYRRDAVLVA